QAGTLENPYRRALVRTTLFPESVPNTRDRLTTSLGLSQYLGGGFAAHARAGIYADSKGVLAHLPELALSAALGRRFLAAIHGYSSAQSRARFYRTHYDELAPELTGDIRLGTIRELALGGYAEYLLLQRTSSIGELSVSLSFDHFWF